MTAPIEIRPVVNVEGCKNFQELERWVWGTDDLDVVPIHVLITALKNGGGLLGAYAEDGPDATGRMVGAAFWWLGAGMDPRAPAADAGRGTGKLKACSHMVGVLPDWQGRHVGLRLKLAQRQAILEQGLTDWVTWTYDPLYRRNGVFNLHRLGATCSTYFRNVYGELNDDLNRGAPSDRCQVDWWIDSEHVARDLQPMRPQPAWQAANLQLLPVRENGRGLVEPVDAPVAPDGRPLAVPIPPEIGVIRQADPALGLAWRFALRAALETGFGAGYTLVDCVHLEGQGWRYILVRDFL
ncbi:MAG: hypothetical protein WDZ49_06340 [Litorilinea sp.]